MIVSETLQRDGFEVLTAGDGEDGLRKFTRHGADLIIADVHISCIIVEASTVCPTFTISSLNSFASISDNSMPPLSRD